MLAIASLAIVILYTCALELRYYIKGWVDVAEIASV